MYDELLLRALLVAGQATRVTGYVRRIYGNFALRFSGRLLGIYIQLSALLTDCEGIFYRCLGVILGEKLRQNLRFPR